MADLKTYLGINDVDIKSVSGLSADYTNTILGSKLKFSLTFECEENQMIVGQIEEPLASSFTITEGDEYFTIDNSGNIKFIEAPDYEIMNIYTLEVKSSRGRMYGITVNVTDVTSDFELLTATELLFETQF